MKIGRILIICILIIIFTVMVGCSTSEDRLKNEIVSLNSQVANLSEQVYTENLENEKLRVENAGVDYQRLQFKSDINMVLTYLEEINLIPTYEGEIHPYTLNHIELINNYFIEFRDKMEEDISLELIDILYPIVIPINIKETEVGFVSKYENAYYYNVAHYITYGREGDYNESKTIRAVGGVEDGFREIFIIEIYQENGEWKVGYTGFGG